MTSPLMVTTGMPAGNACILGVGVRDGVPEIHFTPSPVDGPEAMWFHFRIEPSAAAASAVITCVLHLMDNLLGGNVALAPTGFRPVFRTERRDWERAGAVVILIVS